MAVLSFLSPFPNAVSLASPLSCARSSPSSNFRAQLSSESLPEHRSVLGCGLVSVDFLASVASYPKPDDKIRSTSLKVQGGGNAGNALTCAARLGLNPRLISKVANDAQGKSILEELESDGVDTSFFIVSEEGNSPFTYIIIDGETVQAARKNIPILVDAERKREGLDELLDFASYAICSAKFPQAWTEAPSVPSALLSMLLKLPKLKFVIVTLGEDGCIMLERSVHDGSNAEEIDVHSLLESLKQRKDESKTIPTCISSEVTKLSANGIGTVTGRLFIGTAEKVPPSELVDTTGAGDAFIGAAVYALCAGMPPEKMLSFAAQVAASGCRAFGARTGLPHRTDPRLATFL